MTDVRITMVPIDEVDKVWPWVFDMLEPAVRRSNGRWLMHDLHDALKAGVQWLWVVFDKDTKQLVGACTTQIINYPSARRMAFQFLGGDDFDEWYTPLLTTLERCARDAGCDGTEGTARFGFKRWLEADGYKMKYAVYDKVFEGEDDE